MEKNQKRINFSVIPMNFNENNTPEIKPIRGKNYIGYGENNLYPQKLVELAYSSPIHGAIIQRKTELLYGSGFQFDENNTALQQYVTKKNKFGDTLYDIFKKCSADESIFNAYAINVIWSKDRKSIAEIYHVDYSKIRWGQKDENEVVNTYYYSDNWNDYRPTVKEYPAYNTDETAKKEFPSQLLVVSKYSPGFEYYNAVDYSQAMNYIEAAKNISEYYNNIILNGFTPGMHIDIKMKEIPNDEEAAQINSALQKQYESVKKAGKYVLTFSPSTEEATTFTPIETTNLDKVYQELSTRIQEEILSAHGVTSPLLFGIKTAGQLGGNQELINSYNMYMNVRILPVQTNILNTFNSLLAINGLTPVAIINEPPLQLQFSENIMSQILTVDEMRELVGYGPKPKTTEGEEEGESYEQA